MNPEALRTSGRSTTTWRTQTSRLCSSTRTTTGRRGRCWIKGPKRSWVPLIYPTGKTEH